MGDGHSDGTGAAHSRPNAPGRTPGTGPAAPAVTGVSTALGRALRAGPADAVAEQRALAAFRAARDAGVHEGARTRRRDDWRPRRAGPRRPG